MSYIKQRSIDILQKSINAAQNTKGAILDICRFDRFVRTALNEKPKPKEIEKFKRFNFNPKEIETLIIDR